ncbi:MAG: DUF4386 domain-containing protein [Chloroflexota bacterium]
MTSSSMRRTALVAGVLYLITFISSIPAVLLLDPALTNPDYILGAGADGQVRLGALFDIVNALACIGTAVALYSVVRRQHEGAAIGFVATRILEAAVLMVGTVSILALVTLRETGANAADATSFTVVGQSLVAVRDWSFALGTAVPALNALLLGSLLYRFLAAGAARHPGPGPRRRARVPSWVIGYVLGVTEDGTAWHAIGVAPIFIWELAVGLWMTLKGFRADAPLMIEAAAGGPGSVSGLAANEPHVMAAVLGMRGAPRVDISLQN